MIASPNTAIQKPTVSQSRKIQLTSPILHIGSEVSRLNPFEYVQTGSRVYFPEREILAKALQQRGRLQDYIAAIENRDDITQLLENSFGDSWWNAKTANGEAIFPKITSSRKWTEQKITELRPMIRNGMGQLYIPGSSIKGAIRTAIAYYLLKHRDEYKVTPKVSEIEEKLRQKLNLGDVAHSQKKKFLDDELFMDNLFTNFSLTYQNKKVAAKIGPNTDLMRAIEVTDSQPLLEDKTVNKRGKEVILNLPVVAEVIVSSRFDNYTAKYRASIYTEMVRNVQTEFTLSLDTEMLSWFHHRQDMQIPFQTIDDLIKICLEFAQEQWDAEYDYWQNIKNNQNAQGKNLNFSDIRSFYEVEKCPFTLRLGWGTGMNGTTIDLLLEEELKAQIRDAAGIKAPQFEAPKSRRSVMSANGEIKYVPGWAKFKLC